LDLVRQQKFQEALRYLSNFQQEATKFALILTKLEYLYHLNKKDKTAALNVLEQKFLPLLKPKREGHKLFKPVTEWLVSEDLWMHPFLRDHGSYAKVLDCDVAILANMIDDNQDLKKFSARNEVCVLVYTLILIITA
jgi:hypothetical protein